MNKPETKIDILEIANQVIDAKVNNDLLEAAEKSERGETSVALIKLFNEYGIYGLKCYELIQRLGTIFSVYDGLEGGASDGNT